MNDHLTYYCAHCRRVFTHAQTKLIGGNRLHIKHRGEVDSHPVGIIAPPPGYSLVPYYNTDPKFRARSEFGALMA